jgi:hypothetical protein
MWIPVDSCCGRIGPLPGFCCPANVHQQHDKHMTTWQPQQGRMARFSLMKSVKTHNQIIIF